MALSPKDMPAAKAASVPDHVIAVVDELLTKGWGNGGMVILRQDDIIAGISAAQGVDRHTIFANKWLDFEEAYRAEGWRVDYDKPAYNEDYPATFKFTPNT